MPSSNDLRRLLVESRRDPEAADKLLAYYRPALRLIAEYMVGPGLRRREDASDIVQQTMLEAYAGFDRFQGRSEPELSAWLKQILRRNVTNLVRDNRAAKRDVRREHYFDAADASVSLTWLRPAGKGTSPSQRVIKAEAALRLAQALDQLPEPQRIAIRLRHLEGLSIDEIVAAMQKTPAAVAGLLRRGLEALREQLAGDTSWL